MNKKKREIYENWCQYHIPGQNQIYRVKRNCIFINSRNSVKHELAKFLGGLMLNKWGIVEFGNDILSELESLSNLIELKMATYRKNKSEFITEVVPNKEPSRRIDLVDLNTNDRYEFEVGHDIKKENCITIYL